MIPRAQFDRDSAVSLYLEGLTLKETGQRFGVSLHAIAKELARRGIKRRPNGHRKEVCKRGRPMADWNLYVCRDGTRRCLACKKLAEADRRPDRRAEWGYGL